MRFMRNNAGKVKNDVYFHCPTGFFGWVFKGGEWTWAIPPFVSDDDEVLSLDAASSIIEQQYRDYGEMLDKAKALAKKAHAGQTDKAGVDYFEGHLTSVARNAKGPYAIVVAYLHDILEDTDVTADEIYRMFPIEVSDAVEAITRRKGESYDDYLARVKKNPIAKAVKISDLMNNMDLQRLPNPTEKDINRVLKYSQAMAFLTRN